jgi:hypothetical protein
VLSKLLKRLVSQQLILYLRQGILSPRFQSAYMRTHSTETAVLKVLSDILLALDTGKLAVPTLLDLSAAFNGVDLRTLLTRLRTSYGVNETVIIGFESYLTGSVHHVRTSTSRSATQPVDFEVPQGSVLGPILFLLYCRPAAAGEQSSTPCARLH